MNTAAFALKKSVQTMMTCVADIAQLMTNKVIGFALTALTISMMNLNGRYEYYKH
jgi:hypothetical protein